MFIGIRVCKHGLEVRGSPFPSLNFRDKLGTRTDPVKILGTRIAYSFKKFSGSIQGKFGEFSIDLVIIERKLLI